MNKMLLTVGATLTAFAALAAEKLPTDFTGQTEELEQTGSEGGLSWTGAARAYKIENDVVLVFTDTTAGNCSFTLAAGYQANGRYLLVGGGGPGGNSADIGMEGGGGGAGGFVEASNVSFDSGDYSLFVGAGGEPKGWKDDGVDLNQNNNGKPSYISYGGADFDRALGGGGGGIPTGSRNDNGWKHAAGHPYGYASNDKVGSNYDYSKVDVACGGGGAGWATWGYWQNSDTSPAGRGGWVNQDQGNNGGNGTSSPNAAGGGGGAGKAGKNTVNGTTSGAGGAGLSSDITGEEVWYAGGGAGGAYGHYGTSAVSGGKGGGGGSSVDTYSRAVAVSESGVNSLGGGGAGCSGGQGGHGNPLGTAGNGGSGVVVVRFSAVVKPAEAPVIASKLYNGQVQVADVPVSDAYTVTKNDGGVDAGTYPVVLTLNDGYAWSDGVTDKSRTFDFVIEKTCGDVCATGAAKVYNLGGGKEIQTVIVFTNVNEVGTFTLPRKAVARVLLVGGGGAGGYGGDWNLISAGGGAGGMLTNDYAGTTFKRGVYTVSVGAGGLPSKDRNSKGENGGDSSIANGEMPLYVAYGGGAGGNLNGEGLLNASIGSNGGSGGGGAICYTGGFKGQNGGTGEKGQGFPGGAAVNGDWGCEYRNAGGGGGAGAQGGTAETMTSGGAGGDGLPCDITGGVVWYAGGGAGGGISGWGRVTVSGGKGGGGSAISNTYDNPSWCISEDGVDGLGGGGAGATGGQGNHGNPHSDGGRGGNGIVIVRIMQVLPVGMTVIIR